MASRSKTRIAEVERLRRRVRELEPLEAERDRLAAALAASQERFRTVLAGLEEVVYSVSSDGRVVQFIGDACERLYGRARHEFFANPDLWSEMIHPEDQARVRASYLRLLAGESFDEEYRIVRSDGSVRWVHDRTSLVRDAEGSALRLNGIVSDITGEKLARDRIEATRARLDQALEAARAGAWEWDSRTGAVAWSPGNFVLMGYAPGSVTPSYENWLAAVHPDDREWAEAEVRRALEARTDLDIRFRVLWSDGSIHWIQDVGRTVFDAEGEPRGMYGIQLDVSERQLAEIALHEKEERLRAIVENAPERVSLIDRNGAVLEMNTAGLRMIGSRSADELRGRLAEEFVAVESRPAFREMVEAVFRGEARTLVFDLVAPGNTRRTCETHAVPIREEQPPRHVRAMLEVTRDITERREAEQARQILEAQLRQAQKLEAVGTLAGGIAHDFNNILAAIIGRAELLEQSLPPAAQATASIREILAASERARDLVRRILTFSRQNEDERRPIELAQAMTDAIRLLHATLPASIEIHADFDSDPLVVLGNSTQLQQVLVNLGTNAAHAMRHRGGRLSVSYRRIEVSAARARVLEGLRPGIHACVTVRDDGEGMDAATLERIFEPFFTTKAPGEGTGLGLSVVHGIVRNHEGAIKVESRRGGGTTFTLYFPLSAQPAAREPEYPRGDRTVGHGSILVVDDEPSVVDILTTALDRLGYSVKGHASPTEALAEFRADPAGFDLIVCDLTMPVMSGIELVGRFHDVRPDLPVVLMTGHGGKVDPQSLPERGIREMLSKPFHLRDLEEVVQRTLSPALGASLR